MAGDDEATICESAPGGPERQRVDAGSSVEGVEHDGQTFVLGFIYAG